MSNCVPFGDVFVIIFFFTSTLITDSGDHAITKKTHATIFVIKVFEKNVPVRLSAAEVSASQIDLLPDA